MSVQILHDYMFEDGTITELKFLGVGSDAPKYERFQWIITYEGQRHQLDFLKMDGKKRILFNRKFGVMSLDLDQMELITLYGTLKLRPYAVSSTLP